mgnify:CR=1 FL=1
MQTSDSIIIIPTYNEKENIENIIRTIFKLEKYFHILIIEDNSPDGTADIVRRLQQEFPERLFMIERKGKLGLGTATLPDSNGRSNTNMTTSSKWMRTSVIIPMTCPACIKPAMMRAETWQSAPGISAESMWSTGPWKSTHVILCFQICTFHYRSAHS